MRVLGLPAIAAMVASTACLSATPHHPAPTNHRPSDAQCSTPVGPGSCCPDPDAGCCSGPQCASLACTNDAQCTQGANGRCIASGGGPAGCNCTYDTCGGDADCPKDTTCGCHGSQYAYGGNACVQSNCRTDSDCGPDGFCSPSGDFSLVGYYCHTPQDTCTNDTDCTSADFDSGSCFGEPRCVYSTSAAHWQCLCVPIPL